MKKNQEDIEKLTNLVEEWKSKYLRALADYQNLEKRVETEKTEFARYAAEDIIHELLVVLDTLEKAEKHLKDEGLTIGVKSFWAILQKKGVKRIEVIGKKFNPVEMECVEVIESKNENIVTEEVRAGYKLGEKIIRVAQVKVGKISHKG